MAETLYRLTWRNSAGALCRGEAITERDARAWLENARRNTPGVEYWLEPVCCEQRSAA